MMNCLPRNRAMPVRAWGDQCLLVRGSSSTVRWNPAVTTRTDYSGTGTGTTTSPSIPTKSSGLLVCTGRRHRSNHRVVGPRRRSIEGQRVTVRPRLLHHSLPVGPERLPTPPPGPSATAPATCSPSLEVPRPRRSPGCDAAPYGPAATARAMGQRGGRRAAPRVQGGVQGRIPWPPALGRPVPRPAGSERRRRPICRGRAARDAARRPN
jgi:hypothetical protein